MAGVVFLVVAIAWLAYLLPWFLKHRGRSLEELLDESGVVSDSVKIVHAGTTPAQDFEDSDSDLEISTPLARRAIRDELLERGRTAVRRRRIGLLVTFALAVVAVLLPVFTSLSWWWAVAGPALLVGWVLLSRASVRIVGERIKADLDALDQASEDATVAVRVVPVKPRVPTPASFEQGITLGAPETPVHSLNDPIPAMPVKIAPRPVLPRSVRSVDLSAPVPLRPHRNTAAPHEQDALPLGDLPKAV
jgi:hypothetical protein